MQRIPLHGESGQEEILSGRGSESELAYNPGAGAQCSAWRLGGSDPWALNQTLRFFHVPPLNPRKVPWEALCESPESGCKGWGRGGVEDQVWGHALKEGHSGQQKEGPL